MKKFVPFLLVFAAMSLQAQTPYQRIYSVLNTKCQNSTCHSATSSDALKFDGTETDVYNQIFNKPAQNASSVAKHEMLIKQGHPYMSFLLRKVAGEQFDADLAIDTATEGALMLDINGAPLTNKEIEYIRQWTMYSALQTYPSGIAQPDFAVVDSYYNNPAIGFLAKPAKPDPSQGIQLRMGPVFVPVSGKVEQEWMLQHEVNFPVLPEIYKVEGYMNQQSHHFLLFQFADSSSAATRNSNFHEFGMQEVSITTFTTSFDGNKTLTGAWQDDETMELPAHTAFFWPQKCYLDMNYHVKNYNATSVVPCDFYFNVYYHQRSSNTIEMKSNLINNPYLFLPQGLDSVDYEDGDNNNNSLQYKYLWMLAGHTHGWGKQFQVFQRDSAGNKTQIYDGWYDYQLHYNRGFWDREHPPIEYWDNLLPVKFGKQNGKNCGLVARATYDINQSTPVLFSFQTTGEMELFYYNYTDRPLSSFNYNAINDPQAKSIFFEIMPNPMNNNGKLVYSLDEAAKVSASIVDITGKVVAQLTEENQSEGTHEIAIGSSQNLSKGIYIARLDINGTVYAKKFIVTE